MPTLEKDIERKVARWAKRHKDVMLYWKLTVPGLSGVPDRLLLLRGGKVAFIEYKRPGARPRKLQELLHRTLQEFGFNVEVHDDADAAIKFIEGLINELHTSSAGVDTPPVPDEGHENDGDTGGGGAVP